MKIRTVLVSGLLLLIIAPGFACGPLLFGPAEQTTVERFSMFPTSEAPVEQPVTIYWNEYTVPFIKAETDADAAFTLGTVHAHLRWGQLEILKRLSQGRLSEMIGPMTTDLDHALRILDLRKAVPEMLSTMPRETREWLAAYVRGLNWYMQQAETLPHEYHVLGLEREVWTTEDVIGISRLAGVDLSWIFYVSFLQLPDTDERRELWGKFLTLKEFSPPSFTYDSPAELAYQLTHFSRSGSNSLAVAGRRSATGGALLANDPHLGISIPNFWLLAGVEAPGMHAVGMMIPGLPFFALGRNEDIAWGGTNMRAISSHIFELSDASSHTLSTRNDTIGVRWWVDRDITIRDSELGPVISDAPFLSESSRTLALQWMGHRGDSDEITAFLRVSRAASFEEFRQAFETYAVSAQNMLYADSKGNIGMILAYRQPLTQSADRHTDLIKPADIASQMSRTALDLPYVYNPESSFIASANNKPVEMEIPIGLTYSLPDRIHRMRDIVEEAGTLDISTLKRMQLDVFSESSFVIAQLLVRRVIPSGTLSREEADLLMALRRWDGRYTRDSRGALAFEILMSHLAPRLLAQRAESEHIENIITRGGSWKVFLRPVFESLPADELSNLVEQAVRETHNEFMQFSSWGDMHRLTLQHPLGRLPLIGSRYQVAEYGVAGGNDTLLKTGHRLTDKKHQTTYGAQSRHISDLSDPDANFFVLFGGQDGWLYSPNTTDQIPLWKNGHYIRIPLRLSTVQQSFTRRIRLQPAAEVPQ